MWPFVFTWWQRAGRTQSLLVEINLQSGFCVCDGDDGEYANASHISMESVGESERIDIATPMILVRLLSRRQISHECDRMSLGPWRRSWKRKAMRYMCLIHSNNNNNQSTAVVALCRDRCLLKFWRFCLFSRFFFLCVSVCVLSWPLPRRSFQLATNFFLFDFSNFRISLFSASTSAFICPTTEGIVVMCAIHREKQMSTSPIVSLGEYK